MDGELYFTRAKIISPEIKTYDGDTLTVAWDVQCTKN